MRKSKTDAVRVNTFFMLVTLTVVLASFMLVTGCQKRTATRPETTVPPSAKEQPASEQEKKGLDKITEQKVESIASKDMAASSVEGKEGMFEDILFDYDKYDVKESYRAALKAVSAWMVKNSSSSVSLEGHCDDRGTNEYILALGDRRAKAVKDFLVSLGVPSTRIETISYGEEKPVCTEQSEACWAKNRRAHIVILMKAGK